MRMEKAERIAQRYRDGFAHSRPRHTWNTLLNEWDRRRQGATLHSWPRILQVEVTNRCNLNCRFCSRYYNSLKLGDLPEALLPAVEEASARVLETILFGYGEPLMAPVFYTLLRRVRSSRVSFITNGLALTPETLDHILACANRPIYNIALSIDGARPETYNRIRERSDFETVWRNLTHLVRTSRELPNPFEVWIDFVAIRSNVAELPDLVRMAGDAGVSRINVFHMVIWDDRFRDESLLGWPDLNRRSFESAREAASRHRIRLELPVVLGSKAGPGFSPGERARGLPKVPFCTQPWTYAYVRYDGSVQACCHSEAFDMGNLHRQSFAEVWNGKRYQGLRRVVNHNLPEDCRRCELRFRHTPSPDDEKVYRKGKPRSM